ncbi:MAG: dTMP kinase [Ignavibacteriales bacterium]|nr:MAG: dTMP kinase [Ignavibacteriales bacterium]
MLISFEGLDFCGKSTQVELLVNYLNNCGKRVKVIREPGGTVISEKIRDILLDKKNDKMHIETEILLFSASRSQLVREVIQPYLNDGYYVITDRFYDSTTAYQGFGRQIPLDFVEKINMFAVGGTIPQITFFIDIPIEESDKRKKLRNGGELDRIEMSQRSFYEKVREGYLYLAEKEKRFRIIDGLKHIDEIHEIIIKDISELEMKTGVK